MNWKKVKLTVFTVSFVAAAVCLHALLFTMAGVRIVVKKQADSCLIAIPQQRFKFAAAIYWMPCNGLQVGDTLKNER